MVIHTSDPSTWEVEGQEFKIILYYLGSARPACVYERLSQKLFLRRKPSVVGTAPLLFPQAAPSAPGTFSSQQGETLIIPWNLLRFISLHASLTALIWFCQRVEKINVFFPMKMLVVPGVCFSALTLSMQLKIAEGLAQHKVVNFKQYKISFCNLLHRPPPRPPGVLEGELCS